MLYLDVQLPAISRAVSHPLACVAIYVPTTSLTQDTQASRITFANLAEAALRQLQ